MCFSLAQPMLIHQTQPISVSLISLKTSLNLTFFQGGPGFVAK